MADYHLDATDANVHSDWDRDRDPVLTVAPGETVSFDCLDATGGQLDRDSTPEDVVALDSDRIHAMTGPVAVEGAEPGDVLEVELRSLDHRGVGFQWFYPEEKGLLPEEFDDPGFFAWELEGDVGHFVDGIEVPLAPFPGNIGVAPATAGPHSTTPPRDVGGNLDVKHLTEGATLYLPVEMAGGLFSVGDCHAAQGDGEVCVTAIEAPMGVTCRFDVRSDFEIRQPQFSTSGPFTPTGADESMYATTGVADDLMDATKAAISHMMDHIEDAHGLSRAHAYLLCSAIVDLKVSEVVNAPNWVVTAYLPDSVFPA
ncbi:MAG: acetamidase/formamidase family protein [Haloarculaceae archaeon]